MTHSRDGQFRVFLQALLTFSCLIPTFLIASRVVSNGLALVVPALLAATPVFFGHAFINAKELRRRKRFRLVLVAYPLVLRARTTTQLLGDCRAWGLTWNNRLEFAT